MLALSGLVVAGGAAAAPIGLGTADSFAVLAGAGVTNTGPTIIKGDLGTCPAPAITGFPPGIVNGTIHASDAVCLQAQSDLTIAYNDAAGRAPTTTYPGVKDLGGETLTPGVYKADAFAITGTLTLDAQADPNAVWIFQAGSTLITAPNSRVVLINSAQPCNVFWQVGSSATLGVGSTFVGTVLALTSITANTNATVEGRLLARNGAVTLDSNTVTRPVCAPNPTTTSSSTSTTVAPTTTSSSTSTTVAPTTTSSSTSTTVAPTTTSSSTSTTVAPTTTSSLDQHHRGADHHVLVDQHHRGADHHVLLDQHHRGADHHVLDHYDRGGHDRHRGDHYLVVNNGHPAGDHHHELDDQHNRESGQRHNVDLRPFHHHR